MIFQQHLEYQGKHSKLPPSRAHSLITKTPEQLYQLMVSSYATEIGDICHEFAAERIRYSIKLTNTRADKNNLLIRLLSNGVPYYAIDIDRIYPTIHNYVNDAINFGLKPEVVLVYTPDVFGTADAIDFNNGILRIFDLKTGSTPAHIEQLIYYLSYWALEYPLEFKELKEVELRIYQSNDVIVSKPTREDFMPVIDKIVSDAKFIQEIRSGG